MKNLRMAINNETANTRNGGSLSFNYDDTTTSYTYDDGGNRMICEQNPSFWQSAIIVTETRVQGTPYVIRP